MTNLQNKTKKALKWNAVNQIAYTLTKLIIGIVLARLLSPKEFGLIAMILVITNFSSLLIDSGFRKTIIQKKEINQADLSTIFYFNLMIGTACMILTLLAAPWISDFYNAPQLIPLTFGIAPIYLFNAATIVQIGISSRHFEFKKQAIAQNISFLIGGLTGIVLALLNFGVWSLVVFHLLSSALNAFLLFILIRWMPDFVFKIQTIKEVWSYSSKLLYSAIYSTFINKADIFIVGKIFSASTLGLFSKSKDYSMIPAKFLVVVVSKSFFPTLSKLQENSAAFEKENERAINLITVIGTLIFLPLMLNSELIIDILLGDSWIEMDSFFKVACGASLLYLIGSINSSSLDALGRSDINLRLALIFGTLRLIVMIIVALFFDNPIWLLVVLLFFMMNGFLVRIFIVRSLLKTKSKSYIKILKLFTISILLISLSQLVYEVYSFHFYVEVSLSIVLLLVYMYLIQTLGLFNLSYILRQFKRI